MRLVHKRKPRIPIIVISGKPIPPDSSPDYLTMAMKLGAISSLQKPFKPAALLAAVTECLERAARSSAATQPASGVASGR
jgi:DNA-binding NtrC family response regulator